MIKAVNLSLYLKTNQIFSLSEDTDFQKYTQILSPDCSKIERNMQSLICMNLSDLWEQAAVLNIFFTGSPLYEAGTDCYFADYS